MNYEFMRYGIEDLKPEELLKYLRKSRSDDPTLTTEEVLQRHENTLDEWVEKNLHGKVPEENVYREVVSGETIAERPEVKSLLKRIESPKIRAIAVVDPQRLSRGDLEDIGRLMKLIKHTNTIVITPMKMYNLHDKYDWDAFERELKQGNEFLQYTKMILGNGRLRSVSEGNFISSVPPYGFDKIWVKCGKKQCPTLKENPEQADIVRMIFDMYVNQNMGAHRIALKLNELEIKPPKGERWSKTTIPGILENIHYIGKVHWNFRKTMTIVEDSEIKEIRPKQKVGEYLIYEGKHDGIVPDALFQAAQEKIGKNPKVKSSTKLVNPFAGLLFCKCGTAIKLKQYGGGKRRKNTGIIYACNHQTYCKTGSATYEELLEKVKITLQQCIDDFEVRISNDEGDSVKIHKNLIARLEKRMEELNKEEMNVWEEKAQNRGTIDEMPDHIFRQLKDKIVAEKEEVQQALCKAYESMPEPVDYEEKIVTFKEALEALDDPDVDVEYKNALLKKCIDRMEYTRKMPIRLSKANCMEYGIAPEEMKVGGNWLTEPFELDVSLKF